MRCATSARLVVRSSSSSACSFLSPSAETYWGLSRLFMSGLHPGRGAPVAPCPEKKSTEGLTALSTSGLSILETSVHRAHRREDPPRAAPAVVRTRGTPAAVARDARPLRHPRVRGDAAADPG